MTESKGQPPSETPFGRPDRRSLKDVIKSKRQAREQEGQAADSQRPLPDRGLLRRRVKDVLYRLLGKQTAGESQPTDPPQGIDLDLLEERMREALKRALARPDAQAEAPGEADWAARLDLDLLESQMREILREKTGGTAGEQGSRPAGEGMNVDLLERRVREEIRRFLGSPEETGESERAALGIDEGLMEMRVRQELAKRIPRLKGLGWGAQPQSSQELPIDLSLLEARMTEAVAKAMNAGGPRRGTDMSDEDIDRLIERVLSRG